MFEHLAEQMMEEFSSLDEEMKIELNEMTDQFRSLLREKRIVTCNGLREFSRTFSSFDFTSHRILAQMKDDFPFKVVSQNQFEFVVEQTEETVKEGMAFIYASDATRGQDKSVVVLGTDQVEMALLALKV